MADVDLKAVKSGGGAAAPIEGEIGGAEHRLDAALDKLEPTLQWKQVVEEVGRIAHAGPAARRYADQLAELLTQSDNFQVHKAVMEALERIGSGGPKVFVALERYRASDHAMPTLSLKAQRLIDSLSTAA